MRRRDFIKAIAESPAIWPLAADAQQTTVPKIGFLHLGTVDAFTNNALTSYRRDLQQAGCLIVSRRKSAQ